MTRPAAAFCILAAATASSLFVAGCGNKPKPAERPALAQKYQPTPPRAVPDWLKGSIFEQADLAAIEPYRVSNYGLVIMDRPTGGTANTPNNVREYMIREMVRRGFGSQNQPGFENVPPERVLADPRVTIVRVDGFIPAGATKGQRIDVQVTALDDTPTTSLAGGKLFTTDLAENGANPVNPGNFVNVLAEARGYVFVNPAYTLEANPEDPAKRRALLSGVVLNGGRVRNDRPIGLRIRAAERRLARQTEYRIDLLCGNTDAAAAQDEGMVFVKVPPLYRGDWEHFAGVVLHTFYNADAAFATVKARELVIEAQKPEAPLLDISYTWEALGKPALPEIQSLYTHGTPEVAFAAARAAAFIGDGAAEAALVAMARDSANPFRVTAVQTLSALPSTPSINVALRDLLTVADASVRIEAYRGLVRNNDASVYSKQVGEKFILDIVTSDGPPLVYASRVGVPRIAFIGSTARLPAQTFFTAMDNELSISRADSKKELLTLFYRGATARKPVSVITTPDLAEIVARLGGEGPAGQPRFDFTYGEIVAILGKLADEGNLVADSGGSRKASFVLQDAPGVNRDIDAAPEIPDGPRPVTGAAPQASTTP